MEVAVTLWVRWLSTLNQTEMANIPINKKSPIFRGTNKSRKIVQSEIQLVDRLDLSPPATKGVAYLDRTRVTFFKAHSWGVMRHSCSYAFQDGVFGNNDHL